MRAIRFKKDRSNDTSRFPHVPNHKPKIDLIFLRDSGDDGSIQKRAVSYRFFTDLKILKPSVNQRVGTGDLQPVPLLISWNSPPTSEVQPSNGIRIPYMEVS